MPTWIVFGYQHFCKWLTWDNQNVLMSYLGNHSNVFEIWIMFVRLILILCFCYRKIYSMLFKMKWDHTTLYKCFSPSRNYKWLFIIENVNSTQDTNNDKMWFDWSSFISTKIRKNVDNLSTTQTHKTKTENFQDT